MNTYQIDYREGGCATVLAGAFFVQNHGGQPFYEFLTYDDGEELVVGLVPVANALGVVRLCSDPESPEEESPTDRCCTAGT